MSWVLDWLWQYLLRTVTNHPVASILAVAAFARLFGTVIESGWKGVLFRCGRVHKELEPGFHWRIPLLHGVRKTRIRSVSIDLPPQKLTTSDGMVYRVDANVIYRVNDPATALVQVDDLRKGCEVICPLAVADLVRSKTSHSLTDRQRLGTELTRMLQSRLGRWGIVVEHAGLRSIAPTRQTLRVTQLRRRTEERSRIFQSLINKGLTASESLTLLGSSRRLVESARQSYRRFPRRRTPRPSKTAPRALKAAESIKIGTKVWGNWEDTGMYFPAVVSKRTGSIVHLEYDDGDTEVTDISKLRLTPPNE